MPAQTDKTLLIVDDDATTLLALRRRLAHAGYSVQTASRGADALELARSFHFDAVTLDVGMPGELDGLATARALRREPMAADVPIIFVTGAADQDFRTRCDEIGNASFLSKPYDGEILIRLLESLFAKDAVGEIERISRAKRRQPV
jgi:CheY-like chemotaxis protein